MKLKGGVELGPKDLLVLAIIVVAAAVAFVLFMPRLHIWGWCLTILDIRDWQWWAWTAVGAAAVAAFLTIYLWPERKQE